MSAILSKEQSDFCRSVSFLFWWKKPEELIAHPHRTLAGVMDRGGIDEWIDMERLFPRKFIVEAINSAVCGEFHGWSWMFWRLRYGLDPDVPLPSRIPGAPPPSGDRWFKSLQRPEIRTDSECERLRWTFAVRGMEP